MHINSIHEAPVAARIPPSQLVDLEGSLNCSVVTVRQRRIAVHHSRFAMPARCSASA